MSGENVGLFRGLGGGLAPSYGGRHKFDATASMVGYLYQCRFALFKAIEATHLLTHREGYGT